MQKPILREFLDNPPVLRNAWLKESGLEVYARLSVRYFRGERVNTLELANITAKKQGKGHFTSFITQAEKLAKAHGLAVFIENVLEERFAAFFSNRGYTKLPNTNPPCFILL